MKYKLWVLASILLPLGLWVGSVSENEALAISGCCKQRPAEGAPWYRSGSSLQVCKELNQEQDQDNIFSQSGKVWWDLAC